ncbi:S26 family signal peptidase [Halorientalis brevis]|uniref:S26 family signal peptidase n=1 Tax=Halorientalis brevis TaxID=1126241 RepID=A0ABD6CA69_9EURY|nr:S26 family signal peptidase [Halorientalis brevis]
MSDRSEERRGPRSESSSSPGDTRGGSFLDDFLGSIFAVLGIGLLLFAISGVWPPMVAIESPSMEPNIDTGDLVFVMEEHRFPGPRSVRDTGVVPVYRAQKSGYAKFNLPGDVIIYAPDGDTEATPVIHRAVFWVNESENWYQTKAQNKFLPEDKRSCEALEYCPANHSGFVTLGDNNPTYDQLGSSGVSGIVKPEWVIGTAEFRMPIIGRLRLGVGSVSPVPSVEAAEIAVS